MANTKAIVIVGLAIVSIAVLEVYALSKGINGTGLSISIAAIAGLAGFEAKSLLNKVKKT